MVEAEQNDEFREEMKEIASDLNGSIKNRVEVAKIYMDKYNIDYGKGYEIAEQQDAKGNLVSFTQERISALQNTNTNNKQYVYKRDDVA